MADAPLNQRVQLCVRNSASSTGHNCYAVLFRPTGYQRLDSSRLRKTIRGVVINAVRVRTVSRAVRRSWRALSHVSEDWRPSSAAHHNFSYLPLLTPNLLHSRDQVQ